MICQSFFEDDISENNCSWWRMLRNYIKNWSLVIEIFSCWSLYCDVFLNRHQEQPGKANGSHGYLRRLWWWARESRLYQWLRVNSLWLETQNSQVQVVCSNKWIVVHKGKVWCDTANKSVGYRCGLSTLCCWSLENWLFT